MHLPSSRKVTTKTEQGVYCATPMGRGVMQRSPRKPRFVLVSWRRQNWKFSFCSSRWTIYHSSVLRRILIADCHGQKLYSSTQHTSHNMCQRPLQHVLTWGGGQYWLTPPSCPHCKEMVNSPITQVEGLSLKKQTTGSLKDEPATP